MHQKMMEELARAWSEVAEQAEKREGSRWNTGANGSLIKLTPKRMLLTRD